MTTKKLIKKYSPKIDEHLHHRNKVVMRKRAIEKFKNDIENEHLFDGINQSEYLGYQVYIPSFHGTHYLAKKKKKEKLDKIVQIVLWILVGALLVIGFTYK
jgi:hypothetical protein